MTRGDIHTETQESSGSTILAFWHKGNNQTHRKEGYLVSLLSFFKTVKIG
jgi:hypothetical protein